MARIKMRLLALALAGYALMLLPAQEPKHWTLLPGSAIRSQLPLCRKGPSIDGTWTPSAPELASLEKNLGAIAALNHGDQRSSVKHPEKSWRQYIGVSVNHHHYIYVNAVSEQLSGKPRDSFIQVCDGGHAFWGVLFDPATGIFSDLQVNGYA